MGRSISIRLGRTERSTGWKKCGKFRLTSLERNWILYDVGNSAFVLMVATLIPIFFNALAAAGGLSSVEYLAYWGYASSAVTIITAVLSPILGTVADTKGFKKPIFILCVFVGIVGCCAMGAVSAWLPFLVIFVIAKVGFFRAAWCSTTRCSAT